MNRYISHIPSFRRRASVLAALLFVAVGSFYFSDVSANTDGGENPGPQNLVLGRLVFSTWVGTFSGPMFGVSTANADGTGIAPVTNFPPAVDPSWSPDGTKIVLVRPGPSVGSEILKMNPNGTDQVNLTNTMDITETNPSWSSTGLIAYERGGQIWTMNSDGDHQVPFNGITQSLPSDPAWSPDGSKLAFASGGRIWKINANGTNQIQVTNTASGDSDPAWSPDGTKIIFTKGMVGLSVINADGTNEVPLTLVPADSNPSWSPDGTTIAFRRHASPSGIYVMDVTGANQVRIIADTQTSPSIFQTNDNPVWQPIVQAPNTFTISGRVTRSNVSLAGVTVNLSGTSNAVATTDAAGNYQFSGLQPGGSYTVSPSMLNHYFIPPHRIFNNIDGNKIADFTGAGVCSGPVCAQNGLIAFVRNNDIFTMNADGTNQTNITNNTAADTMPSWSPDGSKITFTSDRDGNSEIYQMNANGGSPIRLTNNPASDTAPDYSPDGLSIIFVSNRDGNSEIYRMDANGSNPLRLTNDAATQNLPSYSPDGLKIVYIVSAPATLTSLYTMNANGSNQQALPNPATQSTFYNRPSYSPDGSKIIFVYGDDITTQNIWTMNANGTNRVMAGFGRSSPTYSPDGTKVAHNCCFSPNQNSNGIWVSNVGGPLGVQLTGANFDDFPAWQPVAVPRRTAFDFDGDARSDLSFFRPVGGIWYVQRSTAGLWSPQWGLSTDILAPADYDGDLKTDVAVWRPSDNNFYVLNSFDGTVRIENFGLPGDVPTGGDWDGDGKADVAVYRPGAQSVFYFRGSTANPQRNITSIPWGVTGDKPVVGDYDGDSRTDAAVYRGGVWYIRYATGQSSVNHFGLADDLLAPADYDADGKTDIAVYRSGVWYLLKSTEGFTAFQFGLANDIPAPADYDGDGRADPTVYREGIWWIRKTKTATVDAIQFGSATDKPIPSAYVRCGAGC